MNKYFISLVVIIICLLGLFTSPVSVFADSRGYDEAEQIRRAGERLDEIDRNQKEQASQRYDAAHGSSSKNSDGGVLVAVVLMVGAGLCFFIIYNRIKQEKEKRGRENNLMLERERMLSKAISLGFNIDDSSKICPACAETIKLKAELCKYCKRSFSKNEVQDAIDSVLKSFLKKYFLKK